MEVDGGDDQVGDWDEISSFGEEGQEGNEVVSVVVGLVVEDYTRLMWWMVGRRHGSCWVHKIEANQNRAASK